MILTCPDCATSYFVEDGALGKGRTVRCASCGASWRAAPDTPLELKVTPEEGAFAAEAPDPDRELFETPPADLPAEKLPKVFRAKAETERRLREAATQGVVWAGLGAAAALVVVAGLVFRTDVVRVWPKTASAYAAVGLPVNQVGLTIENVRAQMGLDEGRPALVVSGVLRNIRARPVTAPPLSIVLLDKDGKRLATRTASPGDPLVPPSQTRSFAVSLVNPPSAASDLEVTFALDHAPAPAAKGGHEPTPASAPHAEAPAHDAHAMALIGPVEDATPLEASDPHALAQP